MPSYKNFPLSYLGFETQNFGYNSTLSPPSVLIGTGRLCFYLFNSIPQEQSHVLYLALNFSRSLALIISAFIRCKFEFTTLCFNSGHLFN